jgi:hypothetical protein
MSPSRRVVTTLLRFYRTLGLLFVVTIAVGDLIGMTVITRVADPEFSLWVMVFGTGARYWLLVVGVILVSMHLRQYVSNGITRRDFTIGAGIAAALMATALALLVPIGHGIESAVLHLASPQPGYPDLTVSLALHEFGYTLVSGLAFIVSGMAVTAGFYRYGGWAGLLFVLPGLLPLGIAESLLSLGERGELDTRFVSFAVAALASLAASAVVAGLYRFLIREAPIRRTAG